MSIRELLLRDQLASAEAAIIDAEVRQRFRHHVSRVPTPEAAVGGPFVRDIPWRFVDDQALGLATEILRRDKERSLQALSVHHDPIDRGLANLFRQGERHPTLEEQGSLTAKGMIRLATVDLSEYIRWAEHIFGNLIRVYASVNRKGPVRSRFDLRGGVENLQQRKGRPLTVGFEDQVRNAIAHGDFTFRADAIDFGTSAPKRLSTSEFYNLHDSLVRTSNALALGLLLFWIEAKEEMPTGIPVPPALAARLAASRMNRPGVRVFGALASELPLVGRQLNAAIELQERAVTMVLGRCCQFAAHLIDAGALGFDRFAIEADHGKGVSSLVLIDPQRLSTLLADDAPYVRLSEAVTETPLIWVREAAWRSRLRLWTAAARAVTKQQGTAVLSDWHRVGFRLGKGRVIIRDIENNSAPGIPRVTVRAVLRDPTTADDANVVRAIIMDLVRRGRRKRVLAPSASELFKTTRIGLPRKPQHVFVQLYKTDGPLRWLKSGGWNSGNVVAVAERTWKHRNPVLVTNPQEKLGRIGVRYEIDTLEAHRVATEVHRLVQELWSKAEEKKRRR